MSGKLPPKTPSAAAQCLQVGLSRERPAITTRARPDAGRLILPHRHAWRHRAQHEPGLADPRVAHSVEVDVSRCEALRACWAGAGRKPSLTVLLLRAVALTRASTPASMR